MVNLHYYNLNIINEKVVLRLCVRFLFCVFPELHWLRQELAEERNPRGISNRPVAPSDWLASAGLGVMPSRRVDQSEGATGGLRLRTQGELCAGSFGVFPEPIAWDGSAIVQLAALRTAGPTQLISASWTSVGFFPLRSTGTLTCHFSIFDTNHSTTSGSKWQEPKVVVDNVHTIVKHSVGMILMC